MIDPQLISLTVNTLKEANMLDVSNVASLPSRSDCIVGVQPLEDVSAPMSISAHDLALTNFDAKESSHPQASD